MGRNTQHENSTIEPTADEVDPHTWPPLGGTDAPPPVDAPPVTAELAPVDVVATLDHEGPIPVGTPVVAAGGQIGEVLSYDPITKQVQITFVEGGRGWFHHHVVSTDVDGLSVADA